jgi:insertion element IS1 protein InsB
VVIRLGEEAAVAERWSFVGKQREPRGLWHARAHHRGHVLAYGLGRRTDAVFLTRTALWEPVGIPRYSPASWGAYTRHLKADEPPPGQRNTQQIERQPLTVRTRSKRLVRQTSCCSKSIQRQAMGLGVLSKRDEFGLRV